MTLYFCAFPDRASLLVDAPDETRARAIALELGEGETPSTVRPIEGIFAAEVFLDEDDEGGELLCVEPLPYVAEVLAALEDEADGAILPATCGDRLEEVQPDGSIVVHVCELAAHDPAVPHEAKDGAGGFVEWAQ